MKRYLGSNSKWTVFPNDFELWEVFTYGPDIFDKLKETTSNKFWLDVMESLSVLWQTDALMGFFFIKNTPLWLNPVFSIPIHRQWFKKGVTTVADFLGTMNVLIPMNTFMETHGVSTNFLDYHHISNKILKIIE